MKLVERKWEADYFGVWLEVTGLDNEFVYLVNGAGLHWRDPNDDLWQPLDKTLIIRYTVMCRGSYMPWRQGSLTMLARDFGRPDLTECMRAARAIIGRQERGQEA